MSYNYYYDLLTDFLCFSDNINRDIDGFLKSENLEEYTNYLLKKILLISNYYPKEYIDNLKKIINFLDENNIDVFMLQNLINQIDIKYNYECFNYEYEAKYANYFTLKNNIAIKKQELIESIRFDYIAALSLRYDENSFNKFIDKFTNDYYILSIKKFLKEHFEIFFDPLCKERALKVLSNIYERKQKNNEDVDEVYRLMNHILNIKITELNKLSKGSFYLEDSFLGLYYGNILEMIISNDLKDNLIDDKLLATAYSIISTNCTMDEKEKEVLSDILARNEYYKRDNYSKEDLKEFLNIHNEYKGKLNLVKSGRGFISNDLFLMYKGLKAFKKYILLYKNDSTEIKQEIKDNIKVQYDYFNYILFDKDISDIKKNQIDKCINILLDVTPEIFEEINIFNKTKEIVKSKKTLKRLGKYNDL